jgi:phosphoribosylanthranilate isomerase
MEGTRKPHIKVCCIADETEARQAIACGASALGLVGKMPSGPGVITDEQIARIAVTVPPPVAAFLLTSETRAEAIIHHHQQVHTSVIQLVDALESRKDYAQIRLALPGIKLVQVIHVVDENSVEAAAEIAPFVDAVLLDSGNTKLAVKELGGTGRVHNWNISRTIREVLGVPVFLAGGLHAGNVREAIETVQPFGLDLCSGVRTNGRLDAQKLADFFKAAGG